MEVVIKINEWDEFCKTEKHEKNCHCCDSGTRMLNNCDIRYTIARDQSFDSIRDVHSHHQQAAEKGMKNSENRHRCKCVQCENKRLERITNQFAWEQTSDKIRVRFERNCYNGKWHYNQPVWK